MGGRRYPGQSKVVLANLGIADAQEVSLTDYLRVSLKIPPLDRA
jgi:hypothetical protein